MSSAETPNGRSAGRDEASRRRGRRLTVPRRERAAAGRRYPDARTRRSASGGEVSPVPFHRFRSLFAFAVAAAAGALPVAAAADVAPPASLVSNYETASGNVLQRDCGFSHQLPGNSSLAVWLFCDTPIASSGGTVIGFIPGSSAAVGPFTPGRVPTDLSEIPTPPAPIESLPSAQAPQRFLPTPDGLVLPDGTTRCGASGSNSYAATWMSGVNREPSSANRSLLLISFTDVCVSGGSAITTERFGIAEYN